MSWSLSYKLHDISSTECCYLFWQAKNCNSLKLYIIMAINLYYEKKIKTI